MLKKHERLSKQQEILLTGKIRRKCISNSFFIVVLILLYSWSKLDGLYLLHSPDVSIVAIGSKTFNIYYLLDGLRAQGWHLTGLQNPPG